MPLPRSEAPKTQVRKGRPIRMQSPELREPLHESEEPFAGPSFEKAGAVEQSGRLDLVAVGSPCGRDQLEIVDLPVGAKLMLEDVPEPRIVDDEQRANLVIPGQEVEAEAEAGPGPSALCARQ